MEKLHLYDKILSPIVTEKSSLGAEYNQITFEVNKVSTKKEIKLAIENIFQVKVKKVNTSNKMVSKLNGTLKKLKVQPIQILKVS